MAACDEEIDGTVEFTWIELELEVAEVAPGRTLPLRAGNVLFKDEETVVGVEVRTIGERLVGNGLVESGPIGGGRPKSNGLFNCGVCTVSGRGGKMDVNEFVGNNF